MEKKYVIIPVIILLIACCFISFNFNSSHVAVGKVSFEMPEGYHEASLTNSGYKNITKDGESIYLHNYDDGNVEKYVNDYIKEKKENHFKPELTNFTVNDVEVNKVTVYQHENTAHYWFSIDDTTYSIFTYNSSVEMDSRIVNMIASVT